MPNYRLILEYDGSGFAGWQVQRAGPRTVQGALEEALARILGQRLRVIGAGRTDAGVHAEGQVASVAADRELPPAKLARALNGVLPDDLAVVSAETVPDDFHARYDARAKLYRYRIWNGLAASPLRAARSHRVPVRLDLEAMREGASGLVGSHDFASFQTAGSVVRHTVRTLARLDVQGEPRGEIDLVVEGDGFLRHMVRILAGTLVEVGLGRRDAGSLAAVLAARDRSAAGRTAPAQGLTLVRVDYGGAKGTPEAKPVRTDSP